MSETLTSRQGSTFGLVVTLKDADGVEITGTYTGSETLTLLLWAGDDQAPAAMAGSSAAWADASLGTVALTLAGSDLALLTPGWYRLLLRLTTGGQVYDAYEATLKVDPQPGAASAPKAYATLDDLRREAAFVDQVITDDPSQQSTLLEYLHAARVEFDGILQSRYRGDRDFREESLDHLLDNFPRGYRSGKESSTLQAWLDDDRLVLTGPTGGRIRRWNALWALYLLCRPQLGNVPGSDTPYQKFGSRCRLECEDILPTLTVEVDTTDPADGVGDVTIDLRAFDTLRG